MGMDGTALNSTLHERFMSNAFCSFVATLGGGDSAAKIPPVRIAIVSFLVATYLRCIALVAEKEILIRIQISVWHKSLSLLHGDCLSEECMARETASDGCVYASGPRLGEAD